MDQSTLANIFFQPVHDTWPTVQRGRPQCNAHASAHWRPRGARFPRINASAMAILAPQTQDWAETRGVAKASLFLRPAPRSSTLWSVVFTAPSDHHQVALRLAALKSAISTAMDRAPCPCENPTGVSVPSVRSCRAASGHEGLLSLRASPQLGQSPAIPTSPHRPARSLANEREPPDHVSCPRSRPAGAARQS
jgi:hypothetical protein